MNDTLKIPLTLADMKTKAELSIPIIADELTVKDIKALFKYLEDNGILFVLAKGIKNEN